MRGRLSAEGRGQPELDELNQCAPRSCLKLWTIVQMTTLAYTHTERGTGRTRFGGRPIGAHLAAGTRQIDPVERVEQRTGVTQPARGERAAAIAQLCSDQIARSRRHGRCVGRLTSPRTMLAIASPE